MVRMADFMSSSHRPTRPDPTRLNCFVASRRSGGVNWAPCVTCSESMLCAAILLINPEEISMEISLRKIGTLHIM